MGSIVKYGMVGGSLKAFIGEVHRKAVEYDGRAELVCGCFSPDPERNEETGAAWGLSEDRVYSDYLQMVNGEAGRADAIDFVSITTPNDSHYDIAKAFLNAGINVVCEKPLCFLETQATELVELARAKGLLFCVTYTYSGYAMVKAARALISSGIGDIIAVNAEYAQDWLLPELSRDEGVNPGIWRTDPTRSGISGCIGDIGTHVEHIVRYMTGLRTKRLLATVNRYGHALELNANILVEYEGGINGAYWCSQAAAGRINGLVVRVFGTEGSVEWEHSLPDQLTYAKKGGALSILSRGRDYLPKGLGDVLPAGHSEGYIAGFASIYRNFISSLIKIKSGLAPDAADLDFPTVEDGLLGVRFIHAVLESAQADSHWIEV